ncbi:hypothetical protein N656DRAFT_375569 [Canariomyces notabilis]|uniref:Uncharacterized protein n=1 Tax=Canariomyces notabilis TaxID=2074819 RepID=A0AAN6T8L5_9PEZI|nr:hypothetical protein N656DRAFT_375569 [Canariomyces arenarius]
MLYLPSFRTYIMATPLLCNSTPTSLALQLDTAVPMPKTSAATKPSVTVTLSLPMPTILAGCYTVSKISELGRDWNGFGVLAEERLVSLVSCIIATHPCMIESFHWTFQSGEEGLIRWPAKAQAVMLQPDWDRRRSMSGSCRIRVNLDNCRRFSQPLL